MTGQLLQPTSRPVLIDCDAEDYVMPPDSDVVSDTNIAVSDAEIESETEASSNEQTTDNVNVSLNWF